MIYFFSGTGNTCWAAETLAQALGDRLSFIPDRLQGAVADSMALIEDSFEENEAIGFCFPVHGWRPPKVVREFVRRLNIDTTGHYVYALCTTGDTVGEAMDIFEKDLAEEKQSGKESSRKAIHLDAAFSLLMPESYVGLPFMDVDKKDREQQKKNKAAADLKGFIAIIRQHGHAQQLTIGRWPKINSRFLGKYFVDHLVTDRPFWVDSQRCVKCGICADVCPVHDVLGGLGYEPQWRHDGSCLSCFTCYHHCPHHAIEYGRQTKHKGQYFFKKR